jgi:hypothetical protein
MDNRLGVVMCGEVVPPGARAWGKLFNDLAQMTLLGEAFYARKGSGVRFRSFWDSAPALAPSLKPVPHVFSGTW